MAHPYAVPLFVAPPDPGPSPPASPLAAGHPAASRRRTRRKSEFAERQCVRCWQWYKPTSGSQLHCAGCRPTVRAEHSRLWRQENPDRAREYHRRYRESHAEAIREYRQAHLEERRGYSREHMRARYHADPKAAYAKARAWAKANPQRMKAIRDRAYRKPCPRCGKLRYRGDYLCRGCKADTNWVLFDCYWCNGLLGVKPGEVRYTKHYHHGCFSALTRAAPLLNVSRERVRQLVNRQLARLGDGYSRAQALEVVMKERLP